LFAHLLSVVYIPFEKHTLRGFHKRVGENTGEGGREHRRGRERILDRVGENTGEVGREHSLHTV
jgi:hypothetical protein